MENSSLVSHYIRADKVMKLILSALFVVSLALAPMYSTWMAAFLIGGATLAAGLVISSLAPGSRISRIVMGVAFMVMTSLHIQQSHGMLEFHFGVFVLIALLLYYRDWVPVVAAAATIAVHHISFYFLQNSGSGVWLLPNTENGFNIVLLHAVYVVVESAVIVWMSIDLKKEYMASSELSATTRKITHGDQIDLSIRTSGDTELLQDFDRYTEAVFELVSQVANNSESVHMTTEQLVTISANLQALATTQQQQTDMIASAVEELTASASEVSANAAQAADAAEQAYANSQACRQSSTTTENDILSLDKQIASASATIASLDQETSEIGSLLNVIRGIAEQTNLLALNAAIEAARAGEQGRGFAVVADEVRSLAMRTQQATEQINAMIESLQKGSGTAVHAIETSQSLVRTCVENTHHSLELIEQVEQAINQINEMNQFIAGSANEQSTVTAEISRNLSEIVHSTADMNDHIGNSKAMVSDLDHNAKQLESVRGRFKS